MEDSAIRLRIREMLATGELPWEDPVGLWAGWGDVKRRAGCVELITQQDVEYEVKLASGTTTLLHRACHVTWLEECEPEAPAAAEPAPATPWRATANRLALLQAISHPLAKLGVGHRCRIFLVGATPRSRAAMPSTPILRYRRKQSRAVGGVPLISPVSFRSRMYARAFQIRRQSRTERDRVRRRFTGNSSAPAGGVMSRCVGTVCSRVRPTIA